MEQESSNLEPEQGEETEEQENRRVLSESIKRFGPPEDSAALNLPGPEILDFGEPLENVFTKDELGNYTLRFRADAGSFSYNSRYEVGEIKKNDFEETLIVKGLFGEHIEKKSGGYYIRTIGYVNDENGYRQFLLDLSTFTNPPTMLRISSAVIASLVGGN